MIRPSPRDERGMTLIELLIAMAVTTVVLGVVMGGILSALRSDQFIQEDSRALEELRSAMNRMTAELREARLVYLGSNARQITFWVDADRDATQDTVEKITWAVEGSGTDGILTRTTAADIAASQPKVTIAREVVLRDTFTYAPPVPSATVVTIQLTSDVALDDTGAPRSVRTKLRLRNAEKSDA